VGKVRCRIRKVQNIPTINEIDFNVKSVLIRGDFDVDNDSNPRADSIREIVKYLQSKNASKIKVIGHTETDYDLAAQLRSEFPGVEFDSRLRDNPGEKTNDENFANELANGWNVYINESFATSHREHASIVGVPRQIKNSAGEVCLGLRFQKEIENLSKVFEDNKKPVIMVISGIKEDKLSYINSFAKFADKILIGGRLPDYKEKIENTFTDNSGNLKDKILWADLIADREDITIHSIEKFTAEIEKAGTIVVSGPLGKFEDEGHRQGTESIFKAVVSNEYAFKVAGGGDTEQALRITKTTEGFNWVSVGGGAMLEFLASGTLPGIQAVL